MEVADKYQATYMDNPEACPVCGSYNLEAGEIFHETWDMYRTIYCPDCGSQWEELFILTGITDLELGNVEIQKQEQGPIQE